jgi:ectoine hydroxylase-related dioxygenase (phytanoyl-CoA dioxygenase family)
MSTTMGIDKALAQLGVGPDTLPAAQRASLDRNGYAVFERVLDADTIAAVRARLEEIEAEEAAAASGTNPRDTGAVRVDDVNHKGPVFDVLWQHPLLLASMHHVLGDFRLSSVTARAAKPGQGHQNMHVDWWGGSPGTDGFVASNSSWLLDDFRAENGCTRVVPGTHLSGQRPEDVMEDLKADHPDQVLVEAPAGSLVVFNGYLWHSGTHNGSDRLRRGIFQVYSRRDQPRQNDQAAALEPETAARLSPAARYVLDA